MLDFYSLVNGFFSEGFKVVLIGGCALIAVVLGKVLRQKHDAKVAAEKAKEEV